ncbi:MAG TPA: L17 family ribosomal protein [Planctomycetota bacterium]|nr:L17 family ribosomal protein [Planctomycetota bacterium]
MKHGVATNHLNRTKDHYRALVRNLAICLFTWSPEAIEEKAKLGKKLKTGKEFKHYGKPYQIKTTGPKAKAARPLVEKLITLGKKGTLHHRRMAISLLGSTLTAKRIVKHIFEHVAPKFAKRNGGYTRIFKLPRQIRLIQHENEIGGGIKRNRYFGNRLGDNTMMVLFELVEFDGAEVQPTGAILQQQAARAEAEAVEKAKKDADKKGSAGAGTVPIVGGSDGAQV